MRPQRAFPAEVVGPGNVHKIACCLLAKGGPSQCSEAVIGWLNADIEGCRKARPVLATRGHVNLVQIDSFIAIMLTD